MALSVVLANGTQSQCQDAGRDLSSTMGGKTQPRGEAALDYLRLANEATWAAAIARLLPAERAIAFAGCVTAADRVPGSFDTRG